VIPDPPLPDCEVSLAARDTMVLYTDGVTEAGPRAALLGEEGLAVLIAAHAGADPARLLEAIENAAVTADAGAPRDDIALLAIMVEQ
jgi:sigma-B regulation protein RsbU (phosphoserine phosphatase)